MSDPRAPQDAILRMKALVRTNWHRWRLYEAPSDDGPARYCVMGCLIVALDGPLPKPNEPCPVAQIWWKRWDSEQTWDFAWANTTFTQTVARLAEFIEERDLMPRGFDYGRPADEIVGVWNTTHQTQSTISAVLDEVFP